MERDAKIANMSKFKEMKKKMPFLPALHAREDGFAKTSSINNGDSYLDGRDRAALCYPDKSVKPFEPFRPEQNPGRVNWRK